MALFDDLLRRMFGTEDDYDYYAALPFFIQNETNTEGTVKFKKESLECPPSLDIYCSTDNSNWSLLGNTGTHSTGITATLPANGRLYVRCNTDCWQKDSNCNWIIPNVECSICGNIMSLLYGEDFAENSELPSNATFSGLFKGMRNIKSAEHLVLPSMVLTQSCYSNMFNGCTGLEKAPKLPATRLADACYAFMFYGCTSLVKAQVTLPATVLAPYCYYYMFHGCTSLTTAPNLPAKRLTDYCYAYMFRGCTSLIWVYAMFTTVIHGNDYPYYYTLEWMYHVGSGGTFYRNRNTIWNVRTPDGVPQGWTIHNVNFNG